MPYGCAPNSVSDKPKEQYTANREESVKEKEEAEVEEEKKEQDSEEDMEKMMESDSDGFSDASLESVASFELLERQVRELYSKNIQQRRAGLEIKQGEPNAEMDELQKRCAALEEQLKVSNKERDDAHAALDDAKANLARAEHALSNRLGEAETKTAALRADTSVLLSALSATQAEARIETGEDADCKSEAEHLGTTHRLVANAVRLRHAAHEANEYA